MKLRDKELIAMQKILDVLRPLPNDARKRILAAVALLLNIQLPRGTIITEKFHVVPQVA